MLNQTFKTEARHLRSNGIKSNEIRERHVSKFRSNDNRH
jgi:hypothetical protein